MVLRTDPRPCACQASLLPTKLHSSAPHGDVIFDIFRFVFIYAYVWMSVLRTDV